MAKENTMDNKLSALLKNIKKYKDTYWFKSLDNAIIKLWVSV